MQTYVDIRSAFLDGKPRFGVTRILKRCKMKKLAVRSLFLVQSHLPGQSCSLQLALSSLPSGGHWAPPYWGAVEGRGQGRVLMGLYTVALPESEFLRESVIDT